MSVSAGVPAVTPVIVRFRRLTWQVSCVESFFSATVVLDAPASTWNVCSIRNPSPITMPCAAAAMYVNMAGSCVAGFVASSNCACVISEPLAVKE